VLKNAEKKLGVGVLAPTLFFILFPFLLRVLFKENAACENQNLMIYLLQLTQNASLNFLS
jgi:hypothetical protein